MEKNVERRRRRRISLQALLGSVVTVSVLVVSCAIIGLQYHVSLKRATTRAETGFTERASDSVETVKTLKLRGEKRTLTLSGALASEIFMDAAADRSAVELMTRMMREGDGIFGLFAGAGNGDYLEVSNLEAAPGLRSAWDAGAGDRWVVVRIREENGQRREIREYLDESLEVTRRTSEPSTYYADLRPWFAEAAEDRVLEQGPYELALVGRQGVSFSMQAHDDTVVGAILLLSTLDPILARGRAYDSYAGLVFNVSGRIIASSSGQRVAGLSTAATIREDTEVYPTLAALADQQDRRSTLQSVMLDGREHFAYVAPLGTTISSAETEFVGFLVSTDEVLGPYRKQALVSAAVSLGIALLLLPIVSGLTTFISRPINRLALESEKVRHRQYDEVAPVPTIIREVGLLSGTIVRMARSIARHEQDQRELRDGIVKLIANAVDQKSPYTGGHCARVPAFAEMLANAASRSGAPPFRDFEIADENGQREFSLAAWLHDCGKITTPEYVVDKGSKLETLCNRISEIRMRFEVLLRDAEIDYWRGVSESPENTESLQAALQRRRQQIIDDFEFVAKCNVGGESMSDEDVARLREISRQQWTRNLDDRIGLSPVEAARLADFPSSTPQREFVLADKPEHEIPHDSPDDRYAGLGFTMQRPALKENRGELYNLSVRRGTLTEEDRYLINEHIAATIQMLESLPWPEELARVPEIAGGHHEQLNGRGYPRGLTAEQLSLPARIMAIADVFEALTAADRPYKKAKTLSESLRIMAGMVSAQHLDADLFRLMLEQGLHREYADRFLAEHQRDTVDEGALLGELASVA